MQYLFARLGISPSTFVLDPFRLCIHSQLIPLVFQYLGKEATQSDIVHLGLRRVGWMGLEAHCCCTNSRRMPTICIAKRVKTIRFLNPVHSVRRFLDSVILCTDLRRTMSRIYKVSLTIVIGVMMCKCLQDSSREPRDVLDGSHIPESPWQPLSQIAVLAGCYLKKWAMKVHFVVSSTSMSRLTYCSVELRPFCACTYLLAARRYPWLDFCSYH